jgi:hypothetical protein
MDELHTKQHKMYPYHHKFGYIMIDGKFIKLFRVSRSISNLILYKIDHVRW